MSDRLRVLWMFYASIAPFPIAISILSCGIYYLLRSEGADITPVLIVKVCSGAVIYFAVNLLGANRLIFYYNLHYARWQLWGTALLFDTLILSVFLMIPNILR